MENRKEQTVRLLTTHYETYPRMQLKDIFKFLHQSSFGCEHLLADPMAATEYIRKEADECKTHTDEWTESLDGAFCRVHLDWIKAGLSPEILGKLFFLSYFTLNVYFTANFRRSFAERENARFDSRSGGRFGGST